MGSDLTPRLQQLFDIFEMNKDVSVTKVYEAFTGGVMECDQRYAQQWLGSYVTKLNRRLKKQHRAIKPGRLKYTYRLISTR